MSQTVDNSDCQLRQENTYTRRIAAKRSWAWEVDPPTDMRYRGKSALGSKLLGKLNGLSQGRIEVIDGDEVHVLGGHSGGLKTAILVSDPAFYRRVLASGMMGSAESYMDGQWSCSDLTALIRIMIRNMGEVTALNRAVSYVRQGLWKLNHSRRANSIRGSKRNIVEHYDLGNDFYSLFLDPTMNYSSGVFDSRTAAIDFPKVDDPLHAASLTKMDRICKKLDLKPGHEVLEIGTGWGAMAVHMAAKYGCHVTTTTISDQQHRLACERVRAAGMENCVTVLKEDYRNLKGTYDKIVSIEMVEAVGHKFMNGFFEACQKRLRPDGEMLLQAITMSEQNWKQYIRSVDFIRAYVFPGGCLPSVGSLQRAAGESTDMRMLHLDDMTPHYATTLMHWKQRFLAKLDAVRELGYDEHLIRLWNFYLSYCEAAFEERRVNCVQVMFGRPESRNDPASMFSMSH